jgi:hypothetical protein
MTYRDTSRAAYQTATIGNNEARVLAFVQSAGSHGATCDEAIERLSLAHQSASPAFTALEKSGKILRTDARRATRTGAKAAVYVFTEPGTLFSSPKPGRADTYRAIVRAALRARATGDWMAFDEALGALPATERTRLTIQETP